MYNALLLLTSTALVLVLFASAIGVAIWTFRRLTGLVAGSAEELEKPRRTRRLDQWNPDHPLFSKRAGQ
jgi:amino acid transporter